MVERKTIQDISREIPIYHDPVYRPPHKPVKTPLPEIPGCLSEIDPELNMDFEENSPYQEGVISETYQSEISHISKNHKNWKDLTQAG